VTAVELDRERTAYYSVLLKCQDGGINSRSVETLLNVVVVDINDNAPTFTSQTYRAVLTENNFIGVSVLQVGACICGGPIFTFLFN